MHNMEKIVINKRKIIKCTRHTIIYAAVKAKFESNNLKKKSKPQTNLFATSAKFIGVDFHRVSKDACGALKSRDIVTLSE